MKNYDVERVCLQQRKHSEFLIVYGRHFWVKSKHFYVVSKGARATAVPGAVGELPSRINVLSFPFCCIEHDRVTVSPAEAECMEFSWGLSQAAN